MCIRDSDDIDVEVKNYWDLFAQMWGPLSKTYYYYDLSFNITDIIAVSYTHLDVYKRQGPWRRHGRHRRPGA